LSWQKKDDSIFLSVRYEEGISLDGPEYPMNIIAKVPFPHLGDAWIKARNKLDNQQWYNTTTAMLLQQSCGRTTRGPDDFSETWILDQSFSSLYFRNKKLFLPWFIFALMMER
jgi:Rad3-related DNA helicase